MRTRTTLIFIPLLLLAIGCSTTQEEPSAAGSREGKAVVLIALDGVPTSALPAFGGTLGSTPNLDRLADESVRFQWAFAQAPESASSLASLLTGLYPTTHGVVEANSRLSGEASSLAELYSPSGVTSAAFLAPEILAEERGFSQGFETFEIGSDPVPSAVRWLERSSEAGNVLLVVGLSRESAGTSETSSESGDIEALDSAVGRLQAAIETTGFGDRAIVAVVSLTGSSVGGGEQTPSVAASATRVPLFLSAPGLESASIGEIVETIDLAPTVLALAGVEPPVEIQGQSLMPLVEGAGTPPYIAFGEWPVAGGSYFAALGGYRLILESDTDGEEATRLYHLEVDPGELTDLAADDERRVTVLRDHLDAWRKMTSAASLDPERRSEELDEDTLEKLRSLGYVQ